MNSIEILKKIKGEVVPFWNEYHSNVSKNNFTKKTCAKIPDVPSSFMCRHATLMLYKILRMNGDKSFKVVGGYMYAPQDVKDGVLDLYSKINDINGVKIKHYWLENDKYVLDITADQVGYEDIVFKGLNDVGVLSRYQKVEFDCGLDKVIGVSPLVNKWIENIDKDILLGLDINNFKPAKVKKVF